MMKTKIVMYNPRGSLILPYDGPPMAILMAACLLDKSKQDIKIIDWHYHDYQERILQECRDAIIFGVTCLTGYQIKGMLESVELAKRANPKIKVVCGGWHPTYMPAQVLQSQFIDYVVIGQGPRTFKNLIEQVENDKLPESVQGVAYRQGTEIKINPPGEIEPLSNFPLIPYGLLDNPGDFLVSTKYGNRVAYLLSSQGCPGNCGFCSESSFYKRKWSYISNAAIKSQITEFKDKYNIDGIIMSDSNFFVNERRVAEFCEMIIEMGVKWGSVAARPDSMARYSDATWRLMRDSGLDGIFIGTESANNDTLKLMNKQCVIEDTIKALEMGKKYNIRMEVPFIIGIPGSDIEKDFKINMQFFRDHRKDAAQFHMFIYTPFPGTALMAKAKELGYKPPEKLEGWINYGLHAEGIIPWIPKKWAPITDQLSVYFQFLAGNSVKIINTAVPKPLRWPALQVEKIICKLSNFRITHLFFRIPLEYKIIKFVIKYRNKIFKRSKLVY
ncbi:MAG: radical SAM protein [Verrucomicrobiota bacterium]